MNLLTSNPYNRTMWKNRLYDPIDGTVVQEGVRFTEQRAMNFENGIYELYEYVIELQKYMLRMQIQIDSLGRAPSNTGAFLDSFDGTFTNMVKEVGLGVIIQAVAAGTTVLPVDSVDGFAVGSEVVVYDGTNREVIVISAIDAENKTISVPALANSYVKGARVAESTAIADTATQTLEFGEWGTFTVSVSEVN